jgi:hypothetical protein
MFALIGAQTVIRSLAKTHDTKQNIWQVARRGRIARKVVSCGIVSAQVGKIILFRRIWFENLSITLSR